MQCQVNLNHDSAYLFEPQTVPFISRQWDQKRDEPTDTDEDKHYHKCNVTERHEAVYDDSEDEEEDDIETTPNHLFVYTIEIEVQKTMDGMEPIFERHEVPDVPRRAIEFI